MIGAREAVLAAAVLALALLPARASADGVMLVDRGPVRLGSARDSPAEAPAHGL